MRSIELFAGAGGLALGTATAGFEHEAVFEWNSNACATLLRNQERGVAHVSGWRIVPGDVRDYFFGDHEASVEFVFGGPPCQPFSLGGKHRGHNDDRNMFPQAVRAVRETRPSAFAFENVKGLLRRNFTDYYTYILCQFEFPDVTRQSDEKWSDHFARLRRLRASSDHSGLRYRVVHQLLNAADFGVPQSRERVFIVGIHDDLETPFHFPAPTHSEDALLYDKWISGEYWKRHRIAKHKRPAPSQRLKRRLEKLRSTRRDWLGEPWQTVRDATGDLPHLQPGQRSANVANHYFNPGARSYPGHTGSDIDSPAKTLKAGDHGVPGGENTLCLSDGSVRYFSVRECARLQTFPDDWVFEGSWTEAMRQLGNAVPVQLANAVAGHLRDAVSSTGVSPMPTSSKQSAMRVATADAR